MFLDWSSAILSQSSGPPSGSFSAPTQKVLVAEKKQMKQNSYTYTQISGFTVVTMNVQLQFQLPPKTVIPKVWASVPLWATKVLQVGHISNRNLA